jgi:hypothetical protein
MSLFPGAKKIYFLQPDTFYRSEICVNFNTDICLRILWGLRTFIQFPQSLNVFDGSGWTEQFFGVNSAQSSLNSILVYGLLRLHFQTDTQSTTGAMRSGAIELVGGAENNRD